MDKVKCMPFIILCMLLTGCGNKNNISEEVSTETAVHTSEIELKGETESSSKNATETTSDCNSFYDDNYQYLWSGEELYIFENGTGNCLYVLTYPTDKWYINGNNACLRDGIFYGASVTNGYAQPDTCFMFAYDLEDNKLLWRSADQTYNSMNFILKDNVILCGYGFTSEDDYLYQLDLHTGEILSRLKLKKQPDLLVYQDHMLYVHTYSYNYTIEIE